MKIEFLKDILPMVQTNECLRDHILFTDSPVHIMVDKDTQLVMNIWSDVDGDFALVNEYEGITDSFEMDDEDLWDLPVEAVVFRKDDVSHDAWLDVYVSLQF